jgi:hypothetical protein
VIFSLPKGEKCCQNLAMAVRRRLRRLAAAAAAMSVVGRRYRPVYRYRRRTVSLRWLDDATVRHLFWFSKGEIQRLVPLLHLEEICWSADCHPLAETALCVLLCRLAYPGWLAVLVDRFGRSPAWCSYVFNDVAVHLWTTSRGLLEWHPLLNYERMALYAEAVSDLLEARDGDEPLGFTAGEGSALF